MSKYTDSFAGYRNIFKINCLHKVLIFMKSTKGLPYFLHNGKMNNKETDIPLKYLLVDMNQSIMY